MLAIVWSVYTSKGSIGPPVTAWLFVQPFASRYVTRRDSALASTVCAGRTRYGIRMSAAS